MSGKSKDCVFVCTLDAMVNLKMKNHFYLCLRGIVFICETERFAQLYEQGVDIQRIRQSVLKMGTMDASGIHELLRINILAGPEIIKQLS